MFCITVNSFLVFLADAVTGNNSPQEFSRVFVDYSYMISWFLNRKCNDYVHKAVGFLLAQNSCEKRIWGPELGASLKITLR